MDNRNGDDNYDELINSSSKKFYQKVAKDPIVPIGVAGLVAIVGYGLFNFKNRNTQASLYLIHLRLVAQGTLLGCITLGLIYNLSQQDFSKLWKKKD